MKDDEPFPELMAHDTFFAFHAGRLGCPNVAGRELRCPRRVNAEMAHLRALAPPPPEMRIFALATRFLERGQPFEWLPEDDGSTRVREDYNFERDRYGRDTSLGQAGARVQLEVQHTVEEALLPTFEDAEHEVIRFTSKGRDGEPDRDFVIDLKFIARSNPSPYGWPMASWEWGGTRPIITREWCGSFWNLVDDDAPAFGFQLGGLA